MTLFCLSSSSSSCLYQPAVSRPGSPAVSSITSNSSTITDSSNVSAKHFTTKVELTQICASSFITPVNYTVRNLKYVCRLLAYMIPGLSVCKIFNDKSYNDLEIIFQDHWK